MRSASSNESVRLSRRLGYLTDLLFDHLRRKNDFDYLLAWEQELNQLVLGYVGQPLSEMRIVEIGYGPRPARLLWIRGLTREAYGIDLDRPLFTLKLSELIHIARTNGALRALKSAVRATLFDSAYYAQLSRKFLERFGRPLEIDKTAFVVGDASQEAVWEKLPVADLVYSEDVFEHIPADKLTAVCETTYRHMRPGGLFVPNINVFTGVTGGHVPEWYRDRVRDQESKRTLPWEHLRNRDFVADTYLNKLRPSDYLRMFSARFEILEATELFPKLGVEFLDENTRSLLSDFSEQELMSNNIRFVLRKPVSAAN